LKKILSKKPKIIHFICHGDIRELGETKKHFLCFEKENKNENVGELDEVTSEDLKEIL